MRHSLAEVALIGCGAVVQEMYAPTLKGLAGVRVVAVSDLDPERAQLVGRDLDAPVKTFDEAVAAAGLVVIAAPPAAHFDLASRALAAQRAVLCEKPFVARESEARELVRLSAVHDSRLYVGHFRRLTAPVRAARELLASGLLGAPQAVEAMEGGRFSWHAKSAYTLTDPLGGVLYDTGSHLLDMVLFATGLDEREFGVKVLEMSTEPEAEPSHSVRARLQITDSEGTLALTVGLSRFEILANLIRIRCERGTVEIPTGSGTTLRIKGPAGDVVLQSRDGEATSNGGFVEQLRQLTAGENCAELAGNRFIGVTQVLEKALNHRSTRV